MSVPTIAVAIVVGLPPPVRQLLERNVAPHIVVRPIPLKQDGGFKLQPDPGTAAAMIERFADEALVGDRPTYDRALIVLLPYISGQLPEKVTECVESLESLGARVCRPQSGTSLWPPRSPRLDSRFQSELTRALATLVNTTFPEALLANEHREVCKELLRGLATHSKMGPNNHSHEDDLWKSRGQDLGPGEREVIVSRLVREGFLARKKNRSVGGTGWVYWIADVQLVRTQYPELEPYLQ